eukprot:55074-Prymnesium_polylepis.1
MKAVVRVAAKGEPLPPEDTALLEAMMKPKEYVVRAYILKARNLVPMDDDGASDPYLVVKVSRGTARRIPDPSPRAPWH